MRNEFRSERTGMLTLHAYLSRTIIGTPIICSTGRLSTFIEANIEADREEEFSTCCVYLGSTAVYSRQCAIS